MKFIIKSFHWIYCLYGFVTFIGGLVLVSPGILIAMMLGQPAGGNLILRLCKLWSDGWLFIIGIRHRNIMDEPISKHRHYVFVANHISYLDIPCIFQVLRNGHFRVLGKKEMAAIPIFGALYKLVVVLVNRTSAEHRAKSIDRLKRTLEQNISVLIFPEGTFNETGNPLKNFYDGAFRIAIETQTPVKPFVFLDTLARLHYRSVFTLTPGQSRAVLLPEIPVAGFTLNDVPLLKQKTYEAMESAILRYNGNYK
jgi:1-acyl-sn-glycerol-3-phosphate acyltransferase